MILAGIDIGTNTLRLLIADINPGSFREIYSDRKITRLGEHLDRTGILSPDAQNRSVTALSAFSGAVDDHRAVAVSAVGTSALRNAANSAEFLSAVKQKTGLDITIVSGEEEALLTVLGVSKALWKSQGSHPEARVIDIGGGSTEIIETGPGQPIEKSLPLGAVYFTERFIKHDPPKELELNVLRTAVNTELKAAFPAPQTDSGRMLVGTAGTITTLAAIGQELTEYDPARINGFRLTREAVGRMVARLSAATLAERRTFKGLEPGREDIVLAGAIITERIMDYFGYSSMLVSDWGLREGIVFALSQKVQEGSTGKER